MKQSSTVFLPDQRKSIVLKGMILILSFIFALTLTGPILFPDYSGQKEMGQFLFFVSRLLIWSSLVLTWYYTAKVEKLPFLFWPEKKYRFDFYLYSIAGMFMILFVLLGVMGILLKEMGFSRESLRLNQIIQLFRSNKGLLIFTALTAGIVEELIFRGYLIPRLQLFFKNPHWAILLSSFFFGLLHFGYGNLFQVLGPFLIGLVFGYHYFNFRNINVLILCHFLWDLMTLFVRLHGKF
jgi:uncharacterized protein